jgi:deoxyribodipyrimidine photo-lyase
MDRSFTPTRGAGLRRLAAFTPRMGQAYAAGRNTDLGPEGDNATSGLSPWIRHRLITEHEAVAAAIAAHGPDGAEAFIQEVFWRTYFKGHLETRPGIWTDYRRTLVTAMQAMITDKALHGRYAGAVTGRTGIDCFDAWATELTSTGWLHNHARMWFASIWIFTLRLPWQLGADFFQNHLQDGDPASNTLSWRWVAGLHTPGKHYVARAENIRRYTAGRFDPVGLNEDPVALTEPDERTPTPLAPSAPPPQGPVALLLHLDDLNPESLPLHDARVVRVGGLVAQTGGTAAPVRNAAEAAMADALSRAANHFNCPATPVEQGWAEDLPSVTAWAPIGPSADALPPCLRIRRDWDSQTWPRTTRSYSQVRAAIPSILRATGILAR